MDSIFILLNFNKNLGNPKNQKHEILSNFSGGEGIFILLLCMQLSNNLFSQLYLTEDWIQTSGIPDTIDYSACKVDGSGNVYVTTNTISATFKTKWIYEHIRWNNLQN